MGDRYDDLAEYNWLMGEIIRHEAEQAEALGELLLRHLHPDRVVDVGCGPGIYLVPFQRQGCRVLGVDGAPEAGKSLDGSEFIHVDLRTDTLMLEPRYDLALCIEVAEHLKPEYADHLMDIVCDAAQTVFFCAAYPGQGGEGHYNEQPQEYWRQKFQARGFRSHHLDVDIHREILSNPAYAHCGWLRWNSFLMTRG